MQLFDLKQTDLKPQMYMSDDVSRNMKNNKSHINIIMLQVDIIHFACKVCIVHVLFLRIQFLGKQTIFIQSRIFNTICNYQYKIHGKEFPID